MATRDRNGALHSEENGQFVSGGGGDGSGFDVEKIEKQPKGHLATVVPGREDPADEVYNLPGLKKIVNPGRKSRKSESYGKRIKTEFGMDFVNISRVDPECANDVYEGLRKCFFKYPMMRRYIKSLVYDPEVTEIAQWRPGSKEIALGRAYGRLEDLVESYSPGEKKGEFPSGTTHATVIMHEFGHALDDYMYKRSSLGFSATLCKRLFGGNMSEAETISRYATKSPREMFAEAFHEWMVKGEKSCVPTKKIIEALRKEINNDTVKI